ncbi:aminopeptidase [Candidatus Bipolaricaulota bacterium]|nr:aminopeptidase [Candidatus Bipolaricaulota bacterium]
MDPRIEKVADVLVGYSVAVKPGQKVMISGTTAAEPLIKACMIKVLQAGGHPFLRVSLPEASSLHYEYSSDEQLAHIPDPLKLVYEKYDALITILSSTNTKELSEVPPEKLRLSSQASKGLFKTMIERTAAGDLNWVLAMHPTDAYAQDAAMSRHQLEEFVYGACLPDPDDPIGYWREFSTWQQRIVDALDPCNTLHVVAPNVDLRMNIKGRIFENCDGKKNMPDGEVFTGPVEDSVEGHVKFSYPTTYQGRRLTGVELWFEKGRVVKARADNDEAFLLQMLDADEGARYVGEFAIGTNRGVKRAIGNTLFDEKIHGSFHMAVGAGMPETGSKNESAIHWDMVCDLSAEGKIYADDALVYEKGEFLIGD